MTSHQTDERLDTILAEYFEQIDSGHAVSPQALLESHPDLAAELREFFDAATFVENLAGPTQNEQTQMLGVHDTARNSLVGETIVATQASGVRKLPDGFPRGKRSPHRESDASRSPSEHFSRYEIVRLLGQGAMGAVYLAYDPSLRRQIALKIPKFNADESPDMSERFAREARAAANLRHANICPVYDVGRVDGVNYISMAYIEGRTLAEELRAGRTFAPREIATIVRKLALAMAKAHAAGIVHRDLKPGNIMLDPDGEPILMDFGLAYHEETDELRLTKSGMIVGSPAYMSPEQIDGDPTKIGPASDIYSLGVVLYEMITGKLPFQGTMMSVIGQIANKEPTPVGVWRPELADSPLERLCRKLLAKRPEERPQSMQDVAAALDYVLSGLSHGSEGVRGRVGEGESAIASNSHSSFSEGVRGRGGEGEKSSLVKSPPPPLSPSPAPAFTYPASLAHERTERAKMFLATTLILAALVGLFGALAGIVYVATNQGTLEITSNVDDVQIEVTKADGTVKVIDLVSGTEVHRLPLGDYTVKVKGNRTDVFLDTNGFQMKRGGKVVVEAALINKTTTIAGATAVPTVERAPDPPVVPEWRLPGPQPVSRMIDHSGSVRAVAFDPDGNHFISAGWDHSLRRWRRSEGTCDRIMDTNGHAIYRAKFLKSGRLVTSGFDGTIRTWDIANNREVGKLADVVQPITAMALAGSEKFVIGSSWDRKLRLWSLEESGAAREFSSRELSAEAGTIWDIALSPDDKQAAAARFDGPVVLWDVEKGEPIAELGKHEGGALAVAYLDDGQKLLSAGRDGALKLWDVAEKKLLREQDFGNLWIESLGTSPDSKYVLVGLSARDKVEEDKANPAAGTCLLFNLQAWNVDARLSTGLPCVYAAAFSPDGRDIVTGSGGQGNTGGGSVCFWRLEHVLRDGQPAAGIVEVVQIPGHAEHVTALAVTGDGKTVISGSADGTVLARDIEPRLTRRALSGHRRDRQVAVAVSRDGRVIASGDFDGELRLNDGDKGVTEIADAHAGSIMSVDLSPDETQLLTTGGDAKIKVWNAVTGELLQTFSDAGTLSDADFSPRGLQFVTAGLDGKLKVWNVAGGAAVQDLPTGATAVNCVAWAPAGNLVAAGMRDGTVRLFAADTGQETGRLVGHADRVRDVVFTPDGKHLVSGSYDRTLRVWNVETGAEIARVEHEKHIFNALAMSPDGRHVFSAGGIWKPDEEKNEWTPENDYAIRMWRLPTGVWPGESPAPPALKVVIDQKETAPDFKHVAAFSGHGGPVYSLAVSPDGLSALSASDDQFVRAWDLPGRKQAREFKADGALRCVAISPDGTRLAWSGGQKEIVVWDLKEDRELRRLVGHRNGVYSLQFTKDGQKLLSNSRDKTVRLWDLNNGEPSFLQETIDRQDIVAALSPDETKVLASSDNDDTLTLWNIADKQPLAKLRGHGPGGVYAAAFSPDGKQIATAEDRGFIFLRDATTGEPRVSVRGHVGRVTGLAFTPDSKHLASGGFDHALCLRDAQTGELVACTVCNKPITNYVAVHPSGQQVLTAGGWFMNDRGELEQPGDFDVHVWELPTLSVPGSSLGRNEPEAPPRDAGTSP